MAFTLNWSEEALEDIESIAIYYNEPLKLDQQNLFSYSKKFKKIWKIESDFDKELKKLLSKKC